MDNNVNNTPAPSNNGKAFSITALVTGILSIVGAFIPVVCYFTLVLGVVGIIFGVKGRKLAPAGQTGMATAGFVCAIIGTAFSAIGVICVIACASAVSTAANSVNYYY